MPIADKKKCQTLINIIGQQAQAVQTAAVIMQEMRAKFIAHDPDTTGTPLEGKVTQASAWIDSVVAAADSVVATAFINAIVPTHRNHALDEEG